MTPELQKKMEEAASGIKVVQDKFEKNNQKTTEQIEKLTENVTKTLEEVQDISTKQKAQEESTKALEKEIAGYCAGTPQEKGKTSKEASHSMLGYLRKGLKLSDNAIDEFTKYIVETTYHDVDDGWAESKQRDLKALVEGVDPQGGFWIKPEMSSKVITRIFETSPIRQVSNVETIGTESLEFTIDDNEFSSGGWVGEVTTRSDTDVGEIGTLTIHAHEQYAQPKATQRLLDDTSFNLENYITRKVSDKFSRTENTAFVTGDGANKPKGILGYAAWTTPGTYERKKVEQIGSNVSADFDSDSLIDLQNSLKEEYQPRAVWMMKRTTFGAVMKLTDGSGRYLLNPQMLFQGVDKIILGQKALFANDMPAIASNALAIVYGDFQEGYTIVDRTGIRILRDPYTNKPYVRFYTTKRTGGAVTNYESFKIMKLGA